jgi:hypothetical protein
MRVVARAVTAVALLALATPAMPCGFEKTQSTTTTQAPSAGSPVVKADKAKPVKAQKAKAPAAQKAPATASN